MPTPVSGPTAAASATPPAPASALTADAAAGKDMFLKLMVAQLRYQNPLQPTDATAFMQQTATFTMVESLQGLVETQNAALVWSRMAAAQDLIGRTVQVTDPATDAPATGEVTGVRATATGPVLTVRSGGTDLEVPLDQVQSVTGSRPTGTNPAPSASA